MVGGKYREESDLYLNATIIKRKNDSERNSVNYGYKINVQLLSLFTEPKKCFTISSRFVSALRRPNIFRDPGPDPSIISGKKVVRTAEGKI